MAPQSVVMRVAQILAPFVLLAARTELPAIAEAARAGVCEVLRKRVDEHALGDAVADLVG